MRGCVFRAAFYCMNEKELVEAAVSYLTNAACADVDLLTDQKVALFLSFSTFEMGGGGKCHNRPSY